MARRTSAICASATGSTKSCIACHTDKRALFLFEHAAGRESCVSCHDPHGSNNHAMLVARTPMLAQRCHIGTRRPSTIYDGAAIQARSIRIIGRGVVNCHQNIHGSNPSGQALVRIGGAHETAIKCSRRHPPHSAGICIRAGRSGNTGGGGRQYRPRRRCRLGPRATGGLCDVGRFQTFGDPTSGPTLNGLRYERDRETWAFSRFDNVGYRDQRYQASFDKFGKVKASFDWNQIPTWYSGVSTGCRRFGLQDNNLRSITFGVDLAPRDTVMFGGSYAFENYSTLQRSRQATPARSSTIRPATGRPTWTKTSIHGH